MDTYEEKYKEIVEQIRKAYLYAQTDSTKAVLEEIFPELKENEDEKILVIIKHCIECRYRKTSTIQGISMEQCFAWLERQGEHANFRNKIQVGDKVTRNEAGVLVNLSQLKRVARPSEKQGEQNFEMKTAEESLGIDSDTYNKIVDECIFGEQKPVDKVEPEFKIGEWIVDKSGFVQQVLDFRGGIYTCTYNSFTISFESIYHHWTIKDAKDGDVLATEDNCICIFDNTVEEGKYPFAYCGLSMYGFKVCDRTLPFTHDNVYPATKEQRDLLFQKMNEAGYTFDFENKKLKKIEQKPEENKGNVGGISPNWSVEDEENFCSVYLDVKSARQNTVNSLSGELKEQERKRMDEVISWLESLKGRVQPKQEWSKEGEQHIDSLLKRLDALCRNKFERTRFAISEDRDWLKSLRPQNRWKPSDEQMGLLQAIINEPKNAASESCQIVLREVLEQLKKLKEE